MKIKTYNLENVTSGCSGKCGITMNKNSGKISITPAAVSLMNLSEGNRLNIIQDEQNPKDFYLEKTEDEMGFVLRAEKNTKNLIFQSTQLVRLVFDFCSIEATSINLPIAEVPVIDQERRFWPVITLKATK